VFVPGKPANPPKGCSLASQDLKKVFLVAARSDGII
jgi:hypothetical protein